MFQAESLFLLLSALLLCRQNQPLMHNYATSDSFYMSGRLHLLQMRSWLKNAVRTSKIGCTTFRIELKMFEDVLQMITISTTFEKMVKATKLLVIYGNPMCMYIYIYTHTIYKHHISPFFRSGFASLVEPSFRFVITLLHFAFLLQTPCFSAATARTAPPCGAGASPLNDAKSHRNHWNYYELSLIIINYHEKISLS